MSSHASGAGRFDVPGASTLTLAGTPRRAAVATAVLLVLAVWSLPTLSHAAVVVAAQTHSAASAASGGLLPERRAPTDWIEYTDETMTPVVDPVTEHLAAARTALAGRHGEAAAKALQAAANALQTQADAVSAIERRRATADMALAQDTHQRMVALVQRIDATATQVAAGRIVSAAQLDRTIDKASRADLERRWLVSDVTTWYPLTTEPRRHFDSALALAAKQDYKDAAIETRRGAAYVRLEAARATGRAKAALDSAATSLERSARRLDTGSLKSTSTLQQDYARADHALALGHRAKAAEAWSRKAYEQAGYELKAAGQGVSDAAGWSSDEVKTQAASAALEARTTGDKLARGGVWVRDEVARAFDLLGQAIDRVGATVGSKTKSQAFDTGT